MRGAGNPRIEMPMMTDLPFDRPTALPCPEAQPEFYDGVLAKRGLAWIVDTVLITVFTLAAGILTLTVGLFLWPIFFLTIGALYRVATIAGGSATWGMRLMGIELRGPDGGRLDPVQAMLHVGGYYASWAFFLLPGLVSIGAIMATPRRQGLSDLVLGTAAINRPD
jgi:uncharacterized RDD family membrane protein YckC